MKARTLKPCIRMLRMASALRRTTLLRRIALRWTRHRAAVPVGVRAKSGPRVSNHFALHMHCRIDAATRVASSLPPIAPRSTPDTRARAVRGDIAITRPAAADATGPMRHAERASLPARHTPEVKHDARPTARIVWMTKHSRLALAALAREERPRSTSGPLPLPRLTVRRAAESVVHRISEQRTTPLRDLTRRTPRADAPPPLHPRSAAPMAHAPLPPMKIRVAPPADPRPSRRPELLVWRTPAMPEAEGRKGLRGATPCVNAMPAPRVSPSHDPASTQTTAAQLADASRRLVVDAALADRLAEDVVRRVEKRIRIERERRGL
jgi:hypothetical protein